jgi:cell division protein FtsB
MSTRKLGTYATREEFLENEIRTLNYHIQSMIDTMKVMSMNRQDMSDELERMKQEIKSAVLAEREACAKVCEEQYEYYGHDHVFAKAIRARGDSK